MLRELHALAERDQLVGDPAFEMAPVAFVIQLDTNGVFKGWGCTKEAPPAEGKKKPKEMAKKMAVPRRYMPESGGGRTAAPYAYFLVDKSDYTLGCAPDGKKGQPPSDEKLLIRLDKFIEKTAACYEATKEEPLKAVLNFLHHVRNHGLDEDLPKNSLAGDNFAFEVGNSCVPVHLIPSVQDYWRGCCRLTGGNARLSCIVTGEEVSTPALFPQIKKVPGAQAAAGVVSFNSSAFESYGWKSSANATVSPDVAQAAAVALNRLLDPAFTTQEGKVLPRLNKHLSEDTVVAYWAKAPAADDFCAHVDAAMEVKTDQLGGTAWQAVFEGKLPETFDEASASRFYAITLMGAQGRVAVRDYLETTVFRARASVKAFHDQLRLKPNTPPPKGKEANSIYPFSTLCECLTSTGKAKDLPGRHAAALFTCALEESHRFPGALLPMALNRMRLEITRTDWIDSHRRDARTALIQAILTRNHPFIMSNKQNSPGYLLGQLFACIERMQYLALGGDINKNLAAKYYSAASTTPLMVFPQLERAVMTQYQGKAMRLKPGGCVNLLKRISELQAQRKQLDDPLPTRLSLTDQGLFSIGYHVERGELISGQRPDETIADQ